MDTSVQQGHAFANDTDAKPASTVPESAALTAGGIAALLAGACCDSERRLPVQRRTMSEPLLLSVLTCPACGFAKAESMPTDACQFYYACTHCGVLLRPNPGECCVFCSFGSVKCPPIQEQRSCCRVFHIAAGLTSTSR